MHQAHKITLLRLNKRMSQKAMAKAIGYELRAYGYWESGHTRIPEDALKKIAQYHEVPLEWLASEDEKFTVLVHVNEEGKLKIEPICAPIESPPPSPDNLQELIEMMKALQRDVQELKEQRIVKPAALPKAKKRKRKGD